MPFEKGRSGNPAGRPKKEQISIDDETARAALKELKKAVLKGEKWAIELVINKKIQSPDQQKKG